jgi:hypothetical protein
MVTTDEDGVVEWKGSIGGAIVEIFCLGVFDMNIEDPLASAAAITGHTINNAAWTSVADYSSIVPANALVFSEWQFTSGTGAQYAAFKDADDADDVIGTLLLLTHPSGSASWREAGRRYGLIAPLSATSTLRSRSVSASMTGNLFLYGYVDSSLLWRKIDDLILEAETPPVAYTDLDLSALMTFKEDRTRIKEALVLLKIKRENVGAGTLQQFAVRENGDARDYMGLNTSPQGCQHIHIDADFALYMLVTTDEDGVIEWKADVNTWDVDITVVGYIPSGKMTFVDGIQRTLNSVEIEFETEPKHIDPIDPTDGRYLDAYTISGPVSPARLAQHVEYEDPNKLLLYFDGELVEGERYIISLTGLENVNGGELEPDPSIFEFFAFGEKTPPTALVDQTLRYDIRNPQTERDAPSDGALGTFVVRGGDLDIETARRYLRKRIWRRLATRRGSMRHIPSYGLEYDDKAPATTTILRGLKNQIEEQIKSEPDVRGVSASVSEIEIGVFHIRITVLDKFGQFDDEGVLGGEE